MAETGDRVPLPVPHRPKGVSDFGFPEMIFKKKLGLCGQADLGAYLLSVPLLAFFQTMCNSENPIVNQCFDRTELTDKKRPETVRATRFGFCGLSV